ncbi:MAG: hypothetical protein ACP5NU_03830 [Methanomicrobiales archaeon]
MDQGTLVTGIRQKRMIPTTMDRYRCSQCSQEYFLKNTCSCCAPPPGPHFCPECGGELFRIGGDYFCAPDNYEMD